MSNKQITFGGCLQGILVIFVLVVGGCMMLFPSSDKSKPTSDHAPTPAATPNTVTVARSHWKKGGFDAVALWEVSIKNSGTQSCGDFTYEACYYSETGNLLGRRKGVIQKLVGPKLSRTFEVNDGFVHSQAERASFELTGWREIPSPISKR